MYFNSLLSTLFLLRLQGLLPCLCTLCFLALSTFALASPSSAIPAIDWSATIIINGQGTKTDQHFDLGNHLLITPDNLNNSYVLKFDPTKNLEKKIKQGLAKPIKNGAWTFYGKPFFRTQIPDVIIRPWRKYELTHFSQRVLTDPQIWADLDNQQGYYFERDRHAQLIVRKANDTLLYLNNTEAKKYFERIINKKHHYQKEGQPLFLYAPKVGKVKVLTQVRLSEILSSIQKIDGDKTVLLIACNASRSINKTLALSLAEPDLLLYSNFNPS